MKHTATTVDLSTSPAHRWNLSEGQRASAIKLAELYNRDINIGDELSAYVMTVTDQVIPESLLDEIHGLASSLKIEPTKIVIANLYYDLLKAVLGCTAFAFNRDDGPLHARNLDWWTEDEALAELSMVTNFVNGPQGDFVTVGWPGLLGAFSGVAKGRFAITLNAVTSIEPTTIAMSVVMLIRDVLQNTADFETAVARLTDTKIANDCLLLVTGTKPGQAVVIERTPSNAAQRWIEDRPFISVTNDYLALDADTAEASSQLLETACARRERIEALLSEQGPPDLETCLSYLDDTNVRMQITVQQMAFQASTGATLLASEADE